MTDTNDNQQPQETKTEKFPTPEEFFTTVSLYKSYKITDPGQVLDVEFYTGTIDVHCLFDGCNRLSVYQSNVIIPNGFFHGKWQKPISAQKLLTAPQMNLDNYMPLFRPHTPKFVSTPAPND